MTTFSTDSHARRALAGMLVAAVCTLAACGGGGGGATAAPAAGAAPVAAGADSGATDSGSASQVINQAISAPLAYAPLATMPAHRYGTGSPQAALFETLNVARLAVGAGALTQNVKLDQMAASQLAYLASHPGAPLDSSRTSGTATTPSERAALAGYAGSVWEEVASNGRYSGGDCATALLDSAYRAAGALSSHRDIGLAYGPVAPGIYACVVSLGVQASASAQLPAVGTLKAWPHPAQDGVRPAALAGEFAGSVGRPILVSMFDIGALPSSRHRVTRFVLLDDGGHALPSRLLANAEMDAGPGLDLFTEASAGRLQSGDLLLLPLAPLMPGRRYTVEFSGTSGALVYDKRWSFTTG